MTVAATPTKLRIARGNPQKRPIRPEPEPAQLEQPPEPPAILNAAGAAEWRRLAPELIRLGVLTVVDLPMFTAFCQIYGRWYEAEEKLKEQSLLATPKKGGHVTMNVWLRIAEAAHKEMRAFAGEFGLTPASRTRLAGVDAARPPAKFEGLLAS